MPRLPMPEEELTPEQTRMQTESLKAAVARLTRLIEIGAPAIITCLALVLVCKRAILLYGKRYWDAWHFEMIESIRNDAGLCATCNSRHHVGDSSCPQCVKDAEEYVDALDKEDEMGGPPCQ